MPSPRYTVRLPSALDAAVQEHIRTSGTPFATLIRDALSAYLADILPTVTPTAADSADTLREVQAHLAALTARVEILELALTAVPTPRRQPDDRDATIPPTAADRSADTVPTAADTAADRSADTAPTAADTPVSPRRPGRPSGPLRQQILDLLQAHPEGLRAEEIRVYLQARRPIGDTLQGMLKGGVITAQGQGIHRRYVLAE
jgi:hypothetical protein